MNNIWLNEDLRENWFAWLLNKKYKKGDCANNLYLNEDLRENYFSWLFRITHPSNWSAQELVESS